MSDTTPTPPADTRQQAVQRLTGVIRPWLYDSLQAGHRDSEYLAEIAAAAVVSSGQGPSSSPALPEPPAPTEDGDWLMPGLPVLWLQRSSVHPIRISSLEMTPAEARLLASTLLAAADVAEEQQP